VTSQGLSLCSLRWSGLSPRRHAPSRTGLAHRHVQNPPAAMARRAGEGAAVPDAPQGHNASGKFPERSTSPQPAERVVDDEMDPVKEDHDCG